MPALVEAGEHEAVDEAPGEADPHPGADHGEVGELLGDPVVERAVEVGEVDVDGDLGDRALGGGDAPDTGPSVPSVPTSHPSSSTSSTTSPSSCAATAQGETSSPTDPNKTVTTAKLR